MDAPTEGRKTPPMMEGAIGSEEIGVMRLTPEINNVLLLGMRVERRTRTMGQKGSFQDRTEVPVARSRCDGEVKAQGSFHSEQTCLPTSMRFDGNEIEMLLTTFGQFSSQKSYVSDRTFYKTFSYFMRLRYPCASFFMIFSVLRSQWCMLEKL